MKYIAALILFVLALSIVHAQDDNIPDNCPYPQGAYYHQNWIIHEDPADDRIIIKDWSTRETVHIISSTDTDAFMQAISWSSSCQYLVISYRSYLPSSGYYHLVRTAVYDLLNGREATSFEDGRYSVHQLSWGPGDTRILVETRFGAFVHMIGGGNVWLTSQGGNSIRSFRAGSVVWDSVQNRISGRLDIAPFGEATYDFISGQLLTLTDSDGELLDPSAANYTLRGRDNGEKYRCFDDHIEDTFVRYSAINKQLVLIDSGTMDPLRVLAEDVDYLLTRDAAAPVWLDDCTKLRIDFHPFPVTFDLTTGARSISTEE